MLNLPASPFTADDIALIRQHLLNNIATSTHALTKMTTSTAYESMPGVVIAAPALPSAMFSQDYYFYWVRDGAISMNQVAHWYHFTKDAEEKAQLKPYLLDYLDFVAKIQTQPELNGVNVLGEPKFNIDGSLWTGIWSRPQNDGAAFQALTLTHIATIFLEEGDEKLVAEKIYNNASTSLLKANLEYTAANWKNPCFGPWEELTGCHFSVRAVQRRALIEGAALARSLNDPGAADYYLQQAQFLENALNTHWEPALGYFFQTYKEEDERGGGLNCSLISGLVNGRVGTWQDAFAPISERALSTAFYVRNTFEDLYQINVMNREAGQRGPLIGRYQNDLYDGNQFIYGNPWFLGTHFMASFYYLAAEQLLEGAPVKITFLVKQFFSHIAPALSLSLNQVIQKNAPGFEAVVQALVVAGDEMLQASKAHTATYADGSGLHMSEQIDRLSGKQVSAPDLSWSYASLLAALNVRAKSFSTF